MRRLFASSAPALAVAVTVALGPRPGVAAVAPAMSFDQMAQAWMGAVTLLAHDDGDHEHGERPHRHHDHGDKGHGGRGGHGPRVGAEGARAVNAKMEEILTRLARIEAKLDRRAAGPARIEMRGPWPPAGGPGPRPEPGAGPRPEVPERARRTMEERIRRAREEMSGEDRAKFDERMKAARERMREAGPRGEGRPEIPEEVREQARKRIEEGRERMDQARQAFRRMEDRIKKLEAEIEQLKAER